VLIAAEYEKNKQDNNRNFLAEAISTAYFFYAQQLCEPCLPNIPCPPCISEQQVITFWIEVVSKIKLRRPFLISV
jgi:hypothetical protein